MKRKSSARKSATVSSLVPINDCLHETLRLPEIKTAERCPRCRLFVRSDGQTFTTVSEMLAADRVAVEEMRATIRLVESMERFEQCKSTGE